MRKVIILSIFTFLYSLVIGQSEQLIVPISNSESSGKLIFNNYKGSVKITGYDGDHVIINATSTEQGGSKSANGMKRIPVSDFQLSAEENNNIVLLNCDCKGKTVGFDIKVPKSFSVQVKTYENAKIEINNITGVIEADNMNGDIVLTNIAGSAVVSVIDGNIKARFTKVDFNSPMAFTSIEGNIELSLPLNTMANLKMKTEYGDIFSDFDIVLDKRKATIKKESSKSIVSLDDWTIGKLNGGGPEYMIKSHNGDIFIKSSE